MLRSRSSRWLPGAACVAGACAAGVLSLAVMARADGEPDVRPSDMAPGVPGATAATPPGMPPAALYDRFCLACHGALGDGRGPAAPWLWPRPRDFTRGEYKWRTTPSGAPPTAADLTAAIRYGVPGTAMHGFGVALSTAQIAALANYVAAFAPEAFEEPEPALAIAAPPELTHDLADDGARAALVARGKQVWTALGCTSCHGEAGKGDGVAAATLRDTDGLPAAPYDLTAAPLRRPRAPGADAAGEASAAGAAGAASASSASIGAIYASIVTGLTGTPMPSYAGAAPEPDLWAVAAYVDSIRFRGESARGAVSGRIEDLDPIAIRLDREQRASEAGYWPGHGDADEARIFGETIALQDRAARADAGRAASGDDPGGEPRDGASLAPAVASISALQCARCHDAQYQQWRDSLHARATSPGLLGQVARLKGKRSQVESCQRCHAPLAEQLPVLRPGHAGGATALADARAQPYRPNPRFDPALRDEGITCAACHVRGYRRYGPPRAGDGKRLALPGYPLTELAIYERADFCLGCHQLPARIAVDGRPLLDTYREWLLGPYMPRGIQCQHCHMPDRDHQWKGVHDPDTFRQGIAVEAIAGRSRATGAVSVRARVRNVGAGHYLPTTPTPAAWLSVELVTARGERVRGAYSERRIGRKLAYGRGGFRVVEDTRIPPGEAIELAAAWREGDVARATHARVAVRVAPDDYYEGLFAARLRGALTPEVRAQFEEALARTRASSYVAWERRIPIADIPGSAAAPRPPRRAR